jgi:hypothetical protein
VLKFVSEKKPPLTAITGVERLLGTASFYAQDIMIRLPPLRPDRRVDALLVLGQSVFRDSACASFNVCIVDVAPNFVSRAAEASVPPKQFVVLSLHVGQIVVVRSAYFGVSLPFTSFQLPLNLSLST